MYKIIWHSTKEIILKTENEDEFNDVLDEFTEQEPYDIDINGHIAIIDDGDPYEE